MNINVNSLRTIIKYLPTPTAGAIEIVRMRDRIDELNMRVPDFSDDSITVSETFTYTELVFKVACYRNTSYDGSLIYEWELEICT